MSGKPAARQGDMTQYGGSIVQGSAGVRIGAPTGVACSVCPGGVTSGHPVNPLLGAKVPSGFCPACCRSSSPAPTAVTGQNAPDFAWLEMPLRISAYSCAINTLRYSLVITAAEACILSTCFPVRTVTAAASHSGWRGGVKKLDEGHRWLHS